MLHVVLHMIPNLAKQSFFFSWHFVSFFSISLLFPVLHSSDSSLGSLCWALFYLLKKDMAIGWSLNERLSFCGHIFWCFSLDSSCFSLVVLVFFSHMLLLKSTSLYLSLAEWGARKGEGESGPWFFVWKVDNIYCLRQDILSSGRTTRTFILICSQRFWINYSLIYTIHRVKRIRQVTESGIFYHW